VCVGIILFPLLTKHLQSSSFYISKLFSQSENNLLLNFVVVAAFRDHNIH
jgi:hypothetical protein